VVFDHLRLWLVAALVLCPAGSPDVTAASLVRRSEIVLKGYDLGGKLIPSWSGGALVSAEAENTAQPVLHVIDGNGLITSTVTLSVKGASLVTVDCFARGADGVIAVAGSAFSTDGRGAPYLAIFSQDGASLRVIRTLPHFPRRVAVASDGSIWTEGEEPAPHPVDGPQRGGTLRPDAGLIRRFDQEGLETASFVPQSGISDPSHIVQASSNYLVAAGDSVVWYCPPEARYVEVSLGGRVLRDIRLDPPPGGEVTGFAITKAGDLFVSTVTHNPGRWEFQRLDRNRGTWEALGGGKGYAKLFGADGDLLVAHTSDKGWNVLEFFQPE